MALEVMQTLYDCGPTAMLNLFRLRGEAVTREQVEKAMDWVDSNRSDTPWQHLKALKRLGVPYVAKQGRTWDELRAEVEVGYPLVCLLRVGSLSWHWVVLMSIEEDQAEIAWGNLTRPVLKSREEFEAGYWKPSLLARLLACDRFSYVIGVNGAYKIGLWTRLMGWLYRNIVGRVF